MDASLPRVRRAASFDLAGAFGFLVALWGASLVVRGAYASLCPGCQVGASASRSIAVGLSLLVGAGAFLWSRELRSAALWVMAPGVVASVASISLGGAFSTLALPFVPVACAAAASGMRRSERWDRAAITWVFAVTALLGALGTGLLALTASLTVVVCVLLGPDPSRFLLRMPAVVDRGDRPRP